MPTRPEVCRSVSGVCRPALSTDQRRRPPKCVGCVGPPKGGPGYQEIDTLSRPTSGSVYLSQRRGPPRARTHARRVDDRRHPHRVGDPSTSTSRRPDWIRARTDSSASASRSGCTPRCCAIPTIASGSRSGSSSTWITAATTSPSIWPSSSSTATGCPPSSAGTTRSSSPTLVVNGCPAPSAAEGHRQARHRRRRAPRELLEPDRRSGTACRCAQRTGSTSDRGSARRTGACPTGRRNGACRLRRDRRRTLDQRRGKGRNRGSIRRFVTPAQTSAAQVRTCAKGQAPVDNGATTGAGAGAATRSTTGREGRACQGDGLRLARVARSRCEVRTTGPRAATACRSGAGAHDPTAARLLPAAAASGCTASCRGFRRRDRP